MGKAIDIMQEIKKIYDYEAKTYDDRYHGDIHFIEDKIISKFIKRMYSKGKKVLDLGCGTGHAITLGDIEPEDYIGVDFSQGMIRTAKEKFPFHTFIEADIRNIKADFYKKSYDVILALYGQTNYIGMIDTREILRNSKWKHYFFISYSGRNEADSDYTVQYQMIPKPESFYYVFRQADIPVSVHGMSLWNELDRDYIHQYETADNPMMRREKDYKYFLVSNLWKDKEPIDWEELEK